jgi:hypothetical protein
LIRQLLGISPRRGNAPIPFKQGQAHPRTNITTAEDQHLHGFTALSNNR